MKSEVTGKSAECGLTGWRSLPSTAALSAFLFLAAATTSAGPLDKLWFIGYPVHFHERRGYLTFDDEHVQELPKGDLFTTGAILGKRFNLLNGFRLQVSGSFDYGKTIDDTLPEIVVGDTVLSTQMLIVFFCGNLIADLQYPMSVSTDASWYWHAGYGCHFTDIAEFEMVDNNPKLKVIDEFLEERRMWSGSVHAGLGFEIAFTPMFGFAASYTLRFWHPIHYGMVRDLFPLKPVDYRERFFSHEVEFILLVKRY
ncbi:MAG: hypothetical protein JXA71_14585 [Chitinispirillaceae bacterium]|nr:hypothetical protein [Chitinispirillaceae bacterium]